MVIVLRVPSSSDFTLTAFASTRPPGGVTTWCDDLAMQRNSAPRPVHVHVTCVTTTRVRGARRRAPGAGDVRGRRGDGAAPLRGGLRPTPVGGFMGPASLVVCSSPLHLPALSLVVCSSALHLLTSSGSGSDGGAMPRASFIYLF